MVRMWLVWWPTKVSCTTSSGGETGAVWSTSCTTIRSTTSKSSPSMSLSEKGKPSCWCEYVARFVRKVKKESKAMANAARARKRSTSFQCGYDPLSYSLNFDTSGRGSLEDDQDYYHIYAFSSRFIVKPRRRPSSITHTLPAAAVKATLNSP